MKIIRLNTIRKYLENKAGYSYCSVDTARSLLMEIDRLRDLAKDAIDEAETGWAYASDYFREKYKVEATIKQLRKALEGETNG